MNEQILLVDRPTEGIPIIEFKTEIEVRNYIKTYLGLNPEVNPKNVVIYKCDDNEHSKYPYELWEIE